MTLRYMIAYQPIQVSKWGQKCLSAGKILMLGLDFSSSSPRSHYAGFIFQCDFCLFTVICVTWRVCPQEQDFLVVDSTPAVETSGVWRNRELFRGSQDGGVLY